MTQNFLLAAFGSGYRWQANLSAIRIREISDSAHITIFTDQPSSALSTHFDSVVETRLDQTFPFSKAAKLGKINAIASVEYARFAYLDCDTFLIGNPQPAFQRLDKVDLLAVHDTWRHSEVNESNATPKLNSGVLFVRKSDELQRTMARWENRYRSSRDLMDQPSFRTEFYRAENLPTGVLPSEFNLRCHEPVHLSGAAVIIHRSYTTDWRTSPPSLARFLNLVEKPRVFVPSEGAMWGISEDGNVETWLMTDHEQELTAITTSWMSSAQKIIDDLT